MQQPTAGCCMESYITTEMLSSKSTWTIWYLYLICTKSTNFMYLCQYASTSTWCWSIL